MRCPLFLSSRSTRSDLGRFRVVSVVRHQSPHQFPPRSLNLLKELNGFLRDSAASASKLSGIGTNTEHSVRNPPVPFWFLRQIATSNAFSYPARYRARTSIRTRGRTRTDGGALISYYGTAREASSSAVHPEPTKFFLLRQMRMTSLRSSGSHDCQPAGPAGMGHGDQEGLTSE